MFDDQYSLEDKEAYLPSMVYATSNVWFTLINRMKIFENSSYWFNLFYVLDVWLNAITAGNPDVTVSGRTGYYDLQCDKELRSKRPGWYPKLRRFRAKCLKVFWNLMLKIIDTTFEPIDGEHHCYQAYEFHIKEFKIKYGDERAKEIVFDKGSTFFLGTLLLVTSLVCVIIYPFTHWVIKEQSEEEEW